MTKYAEITLFTALPLLSVVDVQDVTAATHAKKDNRPNIIFILLDDAGYGDFGCYGQTKTETPNIDALAANGILFTDMYSAMSLSAPSRCCLLTGQHSGHAQIRDNKPYCAGNPRQWDFEARCSDPALEGQAGLALGTPTLGTVMQGAGYKTGMVGKWGLGSPVSESAPWEMGFDFYYGCVCQYLAHNYYPPYMWKNGHKEYINDNVLHPGTPLDEGADPCDKRSYEKYWKGKTYSIDKMYENVVEFVDTYKDNPFFLMWTTPIPHSPLQAPQEWIEKYVEKFGDEEPLKGKWEVGRYPHNYYPCRYPHATFAAMISYFDYQIGQLVEELKRLGIYDNTLIIVTSDNGPANNASSPTVWFDSAQPFRCGKGWGKRTMHEGGIRMPFIASWPAKIKESKVCHDMTCFTDVMPTIAELAGVKAPQNDGVSLVPTLEGKTKKQKKHEYLYWEFPGMGGMLAVRWGNWKGIVEDINTGGRTMQLYDISVPCKDIEQMDRNVAAQHPEIVERMWNYVRESHRPAEDDFFNLKGFDPFSVK